MAVTDELEFLTIPASSKHTATVFLIHGLGDNAYGVKRMADRCVLDAGLAHVKWVMPHSPTRPLTANLGIEMPSWFDIYSFGFGTIEDEEGMLRSARSINAFISKELMATGIDPSRAVIIGFSQGGTMTLLTALAHERTLAGIAVLSGWMPLKHKIRELAASTAASIPVFWGYGAIDQLVSAEQISATITQLLEEIGMRRATPGNADGLDYRVYDGMGHTTSPRELDDLTSWIKKAIPEN